MLNDLRFRMRALLRHREVEEELDEELRFHFDREVKKYIGRGMSEKEARRTARLAFGSHEQVKGIFCAPPRHSSVRIAPSSVRTVR